MPGGFHPLTFRLWDFARRYPRSGWPIHLAGRWLTRGAEAAYRRRLAAAGVGILPPDRCRRSPDIPTQVVVVRPSAADADRDAGLALLLNHMGVPYRLFSVDEVATQPGHCLADADAIVLNGVSRASFSSFPSLSGLAPRVVAIGDARQLLPGAAGLRSEAAAAAMATLRAAVPGGLVTDMLPRRIGLRIDDVEGRGLADYLEPIIRRGWRPNLGIFVADLAEREPSVRDQLARAVDDGQCDASPHALRAADFLFFDLPRGRPFTADEFRARWMVARDSFRAWGLPISPVINPHFHVVSSSGLPEFAEEGMRSLFSDLPLDSMTRVPNAAFLPTGDPSLTTGQAGDSAIRQLYSGDSILTGNRPESLYDFLMHAAGPAAAAERLLTRLSLSLRCGFAAFVTTHEYRLRRLTPAQREDLWDAVESGLRRPEFAGAERVLLGSL